MDRKLLASEDASTNALIKVLYSDEEFIYLYALLFSFFILNIFEFI